MPRLPRPELRAGILEAAAAEFAHKGFTGASLERIAARVDATKGAVYHLFTNKQELLFAVLEELRERFQHTVLPAVDGPPLASGERLRGLLTSYLEFHFAHPELRPLLLVPIRELAEEFEVGLRAELREPYRRVRGRIRQLLAEGVRTGELRCADPAVSAFLLVAALDGIVEQRLVDQGEVEPLCNPQVLVAALMTPLSGGSETRTTNGEPPGTRAESDEPEPFQPAF
jgi:AcrR family transcriptional regulator